MKYRTGTLYNQKHAVWFKRLTTLTCPLDFAHDSTSALQFLSGCQHFHIRDMITERHNLACSMTFKAISKTGSLGSCFVCMDIGSNERMAMQNLQIPDTAATTVVPKWLFPSTSQAKTGLPPVAPISTKTITQQTASNGGGWTLRSGRGRMGENDREHLSSTASHPSADQLSPDSNNPMISGIKLKASTDALITLCFNCIKASVEARSKCSAKRKMSA